MSQLTKEYWDNLHKSYPAEVQKFYDWLEEYKKRINWDYLFCNSYLKARNCIQTDFFKLPDAMQIGVFIQYVCEAETYYGLEIPRSLSAMKHYEEIPSCIQEFFYYENLRNKP